MTLFEYLSIAYSLVLSFAALRIIEGLPDVLDAERRWWVHVVYVSVALTSTALSFWVFWSARHAHWDLLRFLLVLTTPAALYFIACVLIPRDPGAVESWRGHLQSVRVPYFAGVGCFAVSTFFTSWLVVGVSLHSSLRIGQAGLLAVAIAGASNHSERSLVAIAGVYIVALVAFALTFARPAPLAGF